MQHLVIKKKPQSQSKLKSQQGILYAEKPLLSLLQWYILRKKYPYSELFWSSLFPHFPHLDWIRSISPYSVRMRENAGKMRIRVTLNTDSFYAVLFYIAISLNRIFPLRWWFMISILLKSLRRLKLAKVLLENSIFNWKQKKPKKTTSKNITQTFIERKQLITTTGIHFQEIKRKKHKTFFVQVF